MISILLPVRDAAPTLPAALRSLRLQTLTAWECIAVDDGSRDASPEILAAFAARDPRFRVLRQEPAGLVPALQRAARAARFPLLARMDADDISHPRRLEAQRTFLEARPALAAAGCLLRHFPRRGLGRGLLRYERWLNALIEPAAIARSIFVEAPLAHPSVLMRRAAFEAVGGYRDGPWPEDYDLWLRFDAAGYGLGKVRETLFYWRQGRGRASFVDPRYAPAAFTRVKAAFLAPRLRAGGRPIAVWGAGAVGKRLVAALAAEGVRCARFVDIHPGRIGQRIAGLPVSAPDDLAQAPELYVLAAVQRPGAREEIGRRLRAQGRGAEDWLPVA